jgi:hypothetical protein
VGVEAAVKSALGVEKIKECDLEGAAENWRPDLLDWFARAKQKCGGEKRTPGPVRNET